MTARILVIGGSDEERQAINIIEEVGGMEISRMLDRRGDEHDVVACYLLLGSDADLAACAASSGATAFVGRDRSNSARYQILTRNGD